MHQKSQKGQAISVLDAVETLSSIVDMDSGVKESFFLTPDELGLEGETVSPKNVEWVRGSDVDVTIKQVRNIFQVILEYVEGFYTKGSQYLQNQKTVEGIKNIMFLVGEAAKKLDVYTSVFRKGKEGAITKLPEYKKLQEFYRNKVDRKIDESVLSKWVMVVAENTLLHDALSDWKRRKFTSIHKTYVDLDALKSDHEYELLLISKDDGAAFYNHQLIRNMKLVCDFAMITPETERYDVLGKLNRWREELFYLSATEIIESIHEKLKTFYQLARQNSEEVIVASLSKAVLALMMAANPENQKKHAPVKTCSQYFSDFQIFIREVMSSRDFQRMLIYRPKPDDLLAVNILDIVEIICTTLFTELTSLQNFSYRLDQILHNANLQAASRITKTGDSLSLWSHLVNDYSAVLNALKYHVTGPLERDLQLMSLENVRGFDTLHQGNLPLFWFEVLSEKGQYKHIRLPCPTIQEQINHAEISDEFKAVLFRSISKNPSDHFLIFNVQDRISWREEARSKALENLQKSSLFHDALTVVSFDVESDFYYQIGSFEKIGDASTFINEFYEQLNRNDTGYFFPDEVKKELFPNYIRSLLSATHSLFFDQKAILENEDRQNFISIFHVLLQIKLLELIHPTYFSYTCKDGIDTSSMSSALFFIFNQLLNREILSEAGREYLNLMIYGFAFLLRERAMLPERFNRIINLVKHIEKQRKSIGFANFVQKSEQFLSRLFKSPLIRAHIDLPEVK